MLLVFAEFAFVRHIGESLEFIVKLDKWIIGGGYAKLRGFSSYRVRDKSFN